MSDSWPHVTLDDACERITDGTHRSPTNLPSGEFRYVTAKNIRPWGLDLSDISYVDQKTHREIYSRCPVERGDVLYIKDGVTTGLAVVNPLEEQFSMLSSVALLKPRREVLESAYLKHWLNSPLTVAQMTSEMTGTAIKRLVLRQIRAARIPLPSIGQQRLIADKLNVLLAKIDACRGRLDRVPQILKKFREAVLEAAISGRLTEEWRQSTNGKAWSSFSVNDLCSTTFDGPFGSNLKSADYSASGVRVVRLENIGHLEFRGDLKTFISRSKYRSLQKHALVKDDVVFSSFVDEEVRVCLIPESLGSAINKADCFCLRIAAEKALPQFVAYRLATPDTYRDLKEMVRGVTRPRINISHIKGYEISIPPISEQAEIVRRVNELFAIADRLQLRYVTSVARVNGLTPSVLAKAFRGELVPRDPNDEPASEMLERIKKLKGNTVPTKPPKRGTQNAVSGRENLRDETSKIASPTFLSDLLKKRRRLRPEELLALSGLEIDEFYDQLKIEEASGLLREVRKGNGNIDRWLETTR